MSKHEAIYCEQNDEGDNDVVFAQLQQQRVAKETPLNGCTRKIYGAKLKFPCCQAPSILTHSLEILHFSMLIQL